MTTQRSESRGPTPQTRHPDGALADVRDTTQGPTPEIRRAMRADSDEDLAAAAEPGLDRRTRADLWGEQDRLDAEPTPERTVIEPGAPHVAIEAPDDIPHDRSDA